jgi:hypothetical protein
MALLEMIGSEFKKKTKKKKAEKGKEAKKNPLAKAKS